MGRKIPACDTWSYDEDIELDRLREHPDIAWRWRLETCDPADRPSLLVKAQERAKRQLEKSKHARRELKMIYDGGLGGWFDLDAIERNVMWRATPEAKALRIELGLRADPVTEDERILAEVGDGYVTPAQRKRLRYLRKHRENG